VAPLEQLFAFEVEFQRRLRTQAPGTADAAWLHTSYALQMGYERLLQSVGRVASREVEVLRDRFSLAGDARDVLAASDSMRQLLDILPYDD
jgi:hypothetical protein